MHPRVPPSTLRPDVTPPRRLDRFRRTAHRAQRAFLVVNGVPFALASVLSCFTNIPAVSVHGELTLGVVWGILQCVTFVTTAWLFEMRCTRSSDPIEESWR